MVNTDFNEYTFLSQDFFSCLIVTYKILKM